MASRSYKCGGVSQPYPVTQADVALIAPLRINVETRLQRPVDQFELIQVATQIVAGTNYFVKVKIGQGEFVHLRVFKPLPCTNEVARLTGLQVAKTAEEPVVYFDAD